MANLSTAQDNHSDALDSLEQARRIAEKEGHRNELRRINCLIGLSKGTIEFMKFTNQNEGNGGANIHNNINNNAFDYEAY